MTTLASGGGHTELSAGEGLAGGAVPLLDDQRALGLVFEGQADGAPLLDLDGLRLGINEVARRCRSFGDDHAFPRLQALDADFTIFVRPINAVVVADQGSVRIHDLKFRVRQGHTGVDGADLADQEDAVRHILKPHGNDALLSAVCQENGFR